MDTTPLWLIAVIAVIVILLWIALELRHQRKGTKTPHYEFKLFSPTKSTPGETYKTAGGFISYPNYDTVQRHGIDLLRNWMPHPDPSNVGPDDLLVREDHSYYKRIR